MTQPFIIPNDSSTGAYAAPGASTFGQLGQGLADLGIGLGHLLNPDKIYQQQIKDALSSRPELLQSFIALKNDNPDAYAIISKRFPQSVRGMIESGKETPEQQLASARATSELEQLKITQPHIAALANLPTSVLAHMDLTPAELAAVRQMTGREPGESASIAERGALSADVNKYYQGLPADLRQEIDKYEIPYFRHLQDVADAERMRKDLIREHNLDRANDWRDRYRAMTVEMALRKYGVGTPELWDQYYSDPKIQARARDLTSGTTPVLNETDQQLQQMGMAINAEPDRRRALARNQLLRTGTSLYDHIVGTDKITPDEEDKINSIDVPMLQQTLDVLASPQYGGPRLRVSYGEENRTFHGVTVGGHRIGLSTGPKLRITDELGNDVPASVIDQIPINPSAANPHAVAGLLQSNPRALEAWNRIVANPDQISQGLSALRDAEVSQKIPLQNGLWWAITQAIKRVEPTPAPSQQEEEQP